MSSSSTSFEVVRHHYLNAAGEITTPHPLFSERDTLTDFYRMMVKTRLFDQKAIALQRTGQLGTYPSCTGAEAINIGIGFALQDKDIFVPYYRDHGTQLLRGVSMAEILLFWGGDERGNDFQHEKAQHDLPNCIPIATQLSHAAGIATTQKYRHQHQATLATCGDGACSRGDFHEALNLAGVWQLPLVTVINNNQWAISVPRELQTASETLAQKGIAAGIESIQVDGNDVIAVYHHVQQALEKARKGKGPTLIEAISYRLSDHTTADDATRYRNIEDVNEAWHKDPIKRLQHYLHQQQWWDERQEQDLVAQSKQEIQRAVEEYISIEPQVANSMLNYLYHELPDALAQQHKQLSTSPPVAIK